METLKTIILLGLLSVLLMSIGRYAGGVSGMWLMFGISLIMNLGAYFYSDKIALYSAGAKPLPPRYSFIKETVKKLAKKAELPMPKVYLSPGIQPNAFATGRNPRHSAIVVTEGLVKFLEKDEIKGVLAHELSHIRNRDILIATVAAVIASAIMAIGGAVRWGTFFASSEDNDRNPLAEIAIAVVAPIAAIIIQLAISRSREFEADRSGAKLAGKGSGLASALQKIEEISRRVPAPEVNPAFANLYISSPFFSGEALGFVARLFSTHPPVAERVARLREIEQ
ncbi:MAG: protease HtpX [Candidatus Moranbacteria bacterium]|nr:protease HtpX [Candidatus Moranbacteria bacterium]